MGQNMSSVLSRGFFPSHDSCYFFFRNGTLSEDSPLMGKDYPNLKTKGGANRLEEEVGSTCRLKL